MLVKIIVKTTLEYEEVTEIADENDSLIVAREKAEFHAMTELGEVVDQQSCWEILDEPSA